MKKNTEELVNEIIEGKNMAEYLASNAEEFLDISLCAHLKELLKRKGMRVSQVADTGLQRVLSVALAFILFYYYSVTYLIF